MLRVFLTVFVFLPVSVLGAQYTDARWKVVDAMYGGRITAMTVEQARQGWIGRIQEFSGDSAKGPFLTCPASGRTTRVDFLRTSDALKSREIRSDWLDWGVQLSDSGAFLVSMECGTPGTRTYGRLSFLQSGNNSFAYFALDGIIFRTVRLP